MSRSYRKNVYGTWYGYKSMKAWRTKENRRLRHNAKQLINTCEDYDSLIIPILNDYDTLWGSPNDGRKRRWKVPLINQCEWDAKTHHNRWYLWSLKDRYKLINGHHDNCQCYGNHKAYYWELKRK